MSGLVLALALAAGDTTWFEAFRAQPGDAGAPDAGWLEPKLQVSAGAGLQADGGTVDVGPGCYIPSAACLAKGQRGADLEAELQMLRGAPHDFAFSDLFKAAWVGYALGALSALLGIGVACWAATGNVLCR